jgi:hypothetical protein
MFQGMPKGLPGPGGSGLDPEPALTGGALLVYLQTCSSANVQAIGAVRRMLARNP